MSFVVSINLSHFCNLRCPWCYLSKEHLSNKNLLPIDKIKECLEDISREYCISQIDLYGGEVGLLNISYLLQLDRLLQNYTNKINVITNLTKINPYFLLPHVSLSVSYDFQYRQLFKKVFSNIKSLNKNISILTLGIPQILKEDPLILINKLNELPNVVSWEIKKYSPTVGKDIHASNIEYESFINSLLELKDKMKFEFINEHLIYNSKSLQYSSLSNNHLYINPDGKICVLDFDTYNNEYFKELKSLKEYDTWCINEKLKVDNNRYCNNCKYKYHCLTEHIRVPNKDPNVYSCDGNFKLLENVKP